MPNPDDYVTDDQIAEAAEEMRGISAVMLEAIDQMRPLIMSEPEGGYTVGSAFGPTFTIAVSRWLEAVAIENSQMQKVSN